MTGQCGLHSAYFSRGGIRRRRCVRHHRFQEDPVLSLLLGLARLGQSIARSFRNPQFRALLVLYGALLLIGTVFYVRTEGWGILDALYFCVVTLATVGYGDFAPRTSVGKVFTIVYILIGAGVFVVLAAELAVGVIRLGDGRGGSDAAREGAGARGPSSAGDERNSTTKKSS
jgi:voltage-gated potassium channel